MKEHVLESIVRDAPELPGVYIFKQNTKPIYVGKARNLKNRLSSYVRSSDPKQKRIVETADELEYIITSNEKEALLLEQQLIRKYDPKFNVRLKGRPYPYIAISKDEYPYISLERHAGGDMHYFGPFTSIHVAKKYIRLVRELFKIRNCRVNLKRAKLCIEYHMGLCSGPCEAMVDREEYSKNVELAIKFLSGDIDFVVKELESRIELESEKLNFEKAMYYRDMLRAIMLHVHGVSDEDNKDFIGVAESNEHTAICRLLFRNGMVVGKEDFILSGKYSSLKDKLEAFLSRFYLNSPLRNLSIIMQDIPEDDLLKSVLLERNVRLRKPKGEEWKLVDTANENAHEYLKAYLSKLYTKHPGISELEELFGIRIERIDGIDVSHFRGEGNVASVVVFVDGKPSRKDFRRYRLKTFLKGEINDYKAIYEVVKRHYSKYDVPDVLLVDGGAGQLASACKALEEVGRSPKLVLALAKRYEEIYLPDGSKLLLKRTSSALKLLQNIRNQAHRFALNYQRKLREMDIDTLLSSIEGIGEHRKMLLLRYFGSLENLRKASIEELMKVPGIGKALALRIKNAL